MLMGGVAIMAGALASSGAHAQCWGNLNATTSVIGTVNTAFLTAGSAFLSAPGSAPNQQAGGVWVRTVAGTVETQADSNFNASFIVTTPFDSGLAQGNHSCHPKVQQDFAGVQAGHDIAFLNTGSGMNWHFGVLAGYVGVNRNDLTPNNTNFPRRANTDAPSAGIYTAFSKGNFYADAQARLDFFQGESYGQRFDARGYSITGNAGYRFDLGGQWTLEPSAGGVFSRTSVDSLNGIAYFQDLSGALPTTLQIQDVESAIGRASLKLGTTVLLGGGQFVAYPFVSASVLHEFAGDTIAALSSTGVIIYHDPITNMDIPIHYSGGGKFTTSRIGTYAQFGAGSAFQLANTGWLGYARADYRTGDNIQGFSVNAGLRYQLNPETASLKEGAGLKDSSTRDYDWTGPYVGASVGSTWGGMRWTNPGNGAEPDYGGYFASGQAGYNYQTGKLVWGVEADFGASNARGGKACSNDPFTYSCDADLGALGSLTGRLGYAWGRALFYAKGGWAFGEVTAGMNLNYGGTPAGMPPASTTSWENGWTAGGGMEFALTDRWSAKAEYMHYEFPNDVFKVAQTLATGATTAGDNVRVGVNYHFLPR